SLSATVIPTAYALFSAQVEVNGINISTAPLPTSTPDHLVLHEIYYNHETRSNSQSYTHNITTINTGHNLTINQLCQIFNSISITNSQQSVINQQSTTVTNTGGNQSTGNSNSTTITTGQATSHTSLSTIINNQSVTITINQDSSSSQAQQLQWI